MKYYTYTSSQKEKLFNAVSSFIEERNLNPLCFTINSQWLKDNMKLLRDHQFSNCIDGYINSSKHRSMDFEKYDTNFHLPEKYIDGLHNIIKIYKFLRTSPTRYYAPISARFNYTVNEWSLHPGTTRISVLEYIDVNEITLIVFNGAEKLNHVPNYENMRDMDFNKFQNMYKNVRCRVIQYKEFSNYFEISEDHRLVENFTNDISYKIDVCENRILVNNIVCFERDLDNFWVPILENIRI